MFNRICKFHNLSAGKVFHKTNVYNKYVSLNESNLYKLIAYHKMIYTNKLFFAFRWLTWNAIQFLEDLYWIYRSGVIDLRQEEKCWEVCKPLNYQTFKFTNNIGGENALPSVKLIWFIQFWGSPWLTYHNSTLSSHLT